MLAPLIYTKDFTFTCAACLELVRLAQLKLGCKGKDLGESGTVRLPRSRVFTEFYRKPAPHSFIWSLRVYLDS